MGHLNRVLYRGNVTEATSIGLEGFEVQKKFQVREMGYYSWNEHFGCHAFLQSATFKDLSHKDKKIVSFAKHNIHGLTY